MKNKRGLTTFWTVMIVLLGLLVVGGGVWGAYNAGYLSSTSQAARTVTAIDYKGEFDDVKLAEEVSGTDLIANGTFAVTSNVFAADFTTDVDINGTDGTVHTLAFKFEIDGNGVEDFDADGAFSTTLATTEAVVKKVYVMLDEKGLTLDPENALSNFVVDLDNDLDTFDVEADRVDNGDYIMVIELKTLASATIGVSEELMTIDFDATTESDDDSGAVILYNHA